MLLTAPRTGYIFLNYTPPSVAEPKPPESAICKGCSEAGADFWSFRAESRSRKRRLRFELDLFRQAKKVFPCYKHEVSSMYKEKYDPNKICIIIIHFF